VQAAPLAAVYDALAQAGAAPRFIGVKLGRVKAEDGTLIEIEATLETMPSPMWDAVVLPGGPLADARLADVGAAVEFVKEQYRHCKTILLLGDPLSSKLLDAAGIALADTDVAADPGLVQVETGGGDAAGLHDAAPSPAAVGSAAQAFMVALAKHKHFERERDPAPV